MIGSDLDLLLYLDSKHLEATLIKGELYEKSEKT